MTNKERGENLTGVRPSCVSLEWRRHRSEKRLEPRKEVEPLNLNKVSLCKGGTATISHAPHKREHSAIKRQGRQPGLWPAVDCRHTPGDGTPSLPCPARGPLRLGFRSQSPAHPSHCRSSDQVTYDTGAWLGLVSSSTPICGDRDWGGQEARAAARSAGGLTAGSEPGAPRLGWEGGSARLLLPNPPSRGRRGVRVPLPWAELEADRRPPPAGSLG